MTLDLLVVSPVLAAPVAAVAILARAAALDRLHGFGFKTLGLRACRDLLISADSLAWSRDARWNPPLPGCTTHRNCANCHRWAIAWRTRVLDGLNEPAQLTLFDIEEAA